MSKIKELKIPVSSSSMTDDWFIDRLMDISAKFDEVIEELENLKKITGDKII